MKSKLVIGLMLGASLALSACGRAAPDAGQEGVLIAKPWVFGHGGVDSDPIKPGLTFIALSTDVAYVDMQPQTATEHFEDIMSSDGVPLKFDAYIKLQVFDSVLLVQKFGGDRKDTDSGEGTTANWYAQNLQGPFRNIIRNEVKHYGMNEVAITYTANDKIEAAVKPQLEAYLLKTGIPIKLIDFNLGKANPPDMVKDQRIKTASEQQRQLTEQQTTLAEEARKNAETARASADNAYRQAMDLTPEQFISLQQISMQREVCGGQHSQCTFVSPGTSALVGVGK